MQKFSFLCCISLMLFMPLHCSLRARRNLLDSLSLDPEVIALVELKKPQDNHLEKYDLRKMSRAYGAFMYRVEMLYLKKQSCEKDFKKLCGEVEQYKKEYLSPLRRNELLSDSERKPSENYFNVMLLSKLKQVACKNQFSQLLIPLPVLENCKSYGEDFDVNTPYSEVWEYEVFGAWSPQSDSSG